MKAIQSIAQVVEEVENTNPVKLPDDFTVFVPKATDDNYGVVKLSQIDDKIKAHNTSSTAHQDIRYEVAKKQDKLTAGKNIEITEDNVINAIPAQYTAGENIEITDEDVINAKPHKIYFSDKDIFLLSDLEKIFKTPEDYVFIYDTSLIAGNPRVYRYSKSNGLDRVYTNVTDKVYNFIISKGEQDYTTKFEESPLGKIYTAGANIDISDTDVISAKNVIDSASESTQTMKGELKTPGIYLGEKHLTENGVSKDGKIIAYPEISSDDTFAVQSNVDAQIAGIRKNIAYTFDTYTHFTQWLEGTYARDDGVLADSLDIGDSIYIAENNIPDYWVYTKHSPMTIDDFKPYESKIDLKDMVSIAGNQTITGNKDFTGALTKNGDAVATVKEAQKVLTMGADGVEESGTYVFTVADADSYLPYRQTGTKFLLDLHLPIVGALNLDESVAITFGDTSYYLYNILKGDERVTIRGLSQVDKYNNSTGYRFIFEAIYFETKDLTGFYIIPTVSMNEVMALTGAEMARYIIDGGLTDGQLAICTLSRMNGDYLAGRAYKFDITYPATYTWTDLSATIIPSAGDNITITTDALGLSTISAKPIRVKYDDIGTSLGEEIYENPQDYEIVREYENRNGISAMIFRYVASAQLNIANAARTKRFVSLGTDVNTLLNMPYNDPYINRIYAIDIYGDGSKKETSITLQEKLTFDATPTENSANPVKSSGVYTALQSKQNTLTAGTGISIENDTISVTDAGGLTVLKESDFPLSADLLAKVNANPQNYCILYGSKYCYYVQQRTFSIYNTLLYVSIPQQETAGNYNLSSYNYIYINVDSGKIFKSNTGDLFAKLGQETFILSNASLREYQVKAVRDTSDDSVKTGTEIRKAITIRKWH